MKHNYTDTQLQAAIDGAIKSHPFGTIVTREHDSNWLGEQIRRLDLIKSALASLPEPEPEPTSTKPISLPLAECLSLRDWFAGMALQGKATRLSNPHEHRDILSSDCYDIADAMLAAREVKP